VLHRREYFCPTGHTIPYKTYIHVCIAIPFLATGRNQWNFQLADPGLYLSQNIYWIPACVSLYPQNISTKCRWLWVLKGLWLFFLQRGKNQVMLRSSRSYGPGVQKSLVSEVKVIELCSVLSMELQRLEFLRAVRRYSGPSSYDRPDIRTTWVTTKILVLTYDQSLELRPEYRSSPKRVSACAVVNKDPRCVRKRQYEPRYACLWK
jgi:hypothetical protein